MRVACLALPLLVTSVTCSFHYAKVDTSFPDTIAPCLLSSNIFKASTSPSPVQLRCGAVCSFTPYCSLFCVAGLKCDTFNAKVSKEWVGPGSGAYVYDACFSIHPLVGDAALGSLTSAASIYSSYNHAFAVTENFFCSSTTRCYESNIDNPPWWQVDLGAPQLVVGVRISQVGLIDSNVEFRVGNDTAVANNVLLLPPPTATPSGGLELVPYTPVVGRYFFVTEPHSSDIRLCDVWVMTKFLD
ncbi:uncharacterized protein LOC126983988 [Eriocheir sinensis]|uniref:uncharacterized protein LOC126983988 n=1 Tax=Eriocheir sinensis TaxID=95602 RepID=UPI0021C94509|nr:uncharacterized protein LOC126983988 [Eriocheir sinensis]XP_050693241.1 uncharacterized protein LOC126983988 [Eriocheir sinensis]XP_050693242.1 uncharacterized protein LOC126983988 [Eriocheir sinensis]XP_050693243.1 uncharacterized protein LOC126983988 [Eriocheir sinensis]